MKNIHSQKKTTLTIVAKIDSCERYYVKRKLFKKKV